MLCTHSRKPSMNETKKYIFYVAVTRNNHQLLFSNRYRTVTFMMMILTGATMIVQLFFLPHNFSKQAKGKHYFIKRRRLVHSNNQNILSQTSNILINKCLDFGLRCGANFTSTDHARRRSHGTFPERPGRPNVRDPSGTSMMF